MKIKKNTVITIFCMIIYFLLMFFTPYNSFQESEQIKILSVYGVIEIVLIFYTVYLLTGKFLTLYNIFIMFYFLFNYGQCIMWAFGLHTEHEIGKWWIYIYKPASQLLIIKTQIIVLYSAFSFHLGALTCHFIRKERKETNEQQIEKNKLFFKANLILSFITVPCMLYTVMHNLINSMQHGYSSIYYGEFANSGNSILILIGGMGFACLIGLLFHSNFDKKVIKWVFAIFGLYTFLDLASGDRGGFLFKFILLFYLYNTYYKKLNFKKTILYIIAGFFALHFIYALKENRNSGISINAVLKSLNFDKNPLITSFFEMGFSMNILIVLLSHNVIYPFGNTYLNAIIGMPTAHVVEFFKPGFTGVSEWFSQGYLNISYGAGFSIIAETYINYGYYGNFIAQFILGFIIYSLMNLNFKGISYTNRKVLSVATTCLLIPLCRNTFQIFAKNFFYDVIIYYILIIFIYNYFKRKENKT